MTHTMGLCLGELQQHMQRLPGYKAPAQRLCCPGTCCPPVSGLSCHLSQLVAHVGKFAQSRRLSRRCEAAMAFLGACT